MTRATIVALAVLVSSMVDPAEAQDRPGPAAEFAAGWVGFPDNAIANESLVGGAARWYLLPRISVGPEVIYINGDNHSHLVVTGNLTFDILGPIDRRPRPVTPFLVGGGGIFQTRELFPTGTYTSGDPAFTAGGGVSPRCQPRDRRHRRAHRVGTTPPRQWNDWFAPGTIAGGERPTPTTIHRAENQRAGCLATRSLMVDITASRDRGVERFSERDVARVAGQ